MDIKDVKSMKWIRVLDWENLSCSWFEEAVFQYDVDNFVETVFMDVAKRFNIPYTELESVLKEKNSAFYVAKARLFAHCRTVKRESCGLIEMQSLLMIPDVTILGYDDGKTDVKKILEAFAALTDIEKLQVLERLGTVTVKVEYQSE